MPRMGTGLLKLWTDGSQTIDTYPTRGSTANLRMRSVTASDLMRVLNILAVFSTNCILNELYKRRL